MSLQPTIKDVARLAGVSIGTVDRVIHNRGRVSEKSLIAVQDAINTLGYHTSPIASALVRYRNKCKIGVLIPEVESEFWSEALRGVKSVRERLLSFGVELVIEKTSTYYLDDQLAAVKRLLSKDVNALTLIPVEGANSVLDEIIPESIPYATVIEDIPGSRRLFHIGPNDYAMGRLSGRLVSLYIRNPIQCIILAANRQFKGTIDRITGFNEFLKQNNPDFTLIDICEVPLVSEEIGYKSMYEITEQQLEKHPEVNVFYVTNGLTQWAAAAVKNHKRKGSVLVFGYERTRMTCNFINDGIIGATICQGPAQEWYNAISIMYYYLIGSTPAPDPSVINSECRILMKESIPLVNLDNFTLF